VSPFPLASGRLLWLPDASYSRAVSSARTAVCILLLLASFGCATAPAARPEAEAADAGLPPVASFAGDPPLAFVRISPDGESLAGLASSGFVVHKPLRGTEILRLAQYDQPGHVVRDVGWVGDGVVAVVVEDLLAAGKGGPRRVHVEAFRIERWHASPLGEGFSFSVPPGVRAEDAVLHWLPDDPDHVLVMEWEPGAPGASVRRARVDDGLGPVVAPASLGAVRWFADAAGAVRAARVRDPEGLTETVYARSDEAGDFEPLLAEDLIEESELAFAGFAADPHRVYVTGLGEDGSRGLYLYDLDRRQRGALIEGGTVAGLGRLVYEPGSDQLRAVTIAPDSPSQEVLDPELVAEVASIEATFPGRFHRAVSADRSGRMAIVEVSGDTQPPEYFVYDRNARQMDFLFTAHPELDPDRLTPASAVRFTTRDGVTVPASLTVPRGLAARALPAIAIVRDGASPCEAWAWDATAQLLSSRGFAVFQPDLSRRERAGAADADERARSDDLADGIAWLVGEGIADPERIGVYGTGSGGDAALLSLIESPDLFRAAASYGAVTDWVALREVPLRLGAVEPSLPFRDTAQDRERLGAISPALHAAEIRAPVMLGQGELDARVPGAQAEALASALEAAGGDVDLQLYRGEADPFTEAAHRIDFLQRLVAFFRRHLGDRAPL